MKNTPVPQGNYIPASRYGNLIYTSGMTPRYNGVLMFKGKIEVSESIDSYREAVRLAASNALIAVRNSLKKDEFLEEIVTLTVYIAAEEGFQAHSQIADFASEYLYEEIGKEGIGSRAAVGVSSLPGNAPVEIQIVAEVSHK